MQKQTDIDRILSPVSKFGLLTDILYSCLETKSDINQFQQTEFFRKFSDSLIEIAILAYQNFDLIRQLKPEQEAFEIATCMRKLSMASRNLYKWVKILFQDFFTRWRSPRD